MRPLIALGVYLMAVFFGAALLAPWVYDGMQLIAEHLPIFRPLSHQAFHRYVGRCMLVVALVGSYPLVRLLRLNSLTQIGLTKSAHAWRNIFNGLALGFISLACAAILPIIFGARNWQSARSAFDMLKHLANAGAAAIVVGFLEELLFRGIVFGSLRAGAGWKIAALVSSGVYAIVHFFQRVTAPEPIVWTSGLLVLNRMLSGFTDIHQLWPGFANLFVAGLILAVLYQKTGSLYYSMGLHAGWIFWLKSYGFIATEGADGNARWWGTTKLIDGWMAFVILGIVFGILVCGPNNRNKTENV